MFYHTINIMLLQVHETGFVQICCCTLPEALFQETNLLHAAQCAACEFQGRSVWLLVLPNNVI